MSTNYEKIAAAIEYLGRHATEQPELETVAAALHTSPFHFQRLFTEWAGVSPKKFLQYLTVEHAKQLLAAQKYTVFETAQETGLSGTGRLHDLFVHIEGMTPGEFRNGGANLSIHYGMAECRFGKYIAAATDKGICHLAFFDADENAAIAALEECWPNARLLQGRHHHQQAVQSFFEQDFADTAAIKLHLRASAFQLKVWQALLQIPLGGIVSYGSIAAQVQQPAAARAVGTAIGSNPVAYIIPCHRVIRSMGETGGYRWGQVRKKAMLAWEAGKTAVGTGVA
jgi:AraC family transcriptional regulator, regulatory protein of adaptative response / methylated-DNA-[protein]-cysteine methyltransferase